MKINKTNLIIDFDSTFIKIETLDALAKISLKDSLNKEKNIKKIADITFNAMNGEIPFDLALTQRIKLLQASIRFSLYDATILGEPPNECPRTPIFDKSTESHTKFVLFLSNIIF